MAIRITESNARDLRLMRRRVLGRDMAGTASDRGYLPMPLVWVQLTANLDSGGEATANPVTLSDTPARIVYTSETVTVKDVIGEFWGVHGERLLCLQVGTGSGVVYQPVSSGAPRHQALLGAILYKGGNVSATVNIGANSRTVTVYDYYLATGTSLANGTTVAIAYDVELARWIVVNATCT